MEELQEVEKSNALAHAEKARFAEDLERFKARETL
jgi:hypothetical protein